MEIRAEQLQIGYGDYIAVQDMDIQVDGGINAETISVAAKAGANVFVSGNALFSAEDMRARIAEFKSLAAV